MRVLSILMLSFVGYFVQAQNNCTIFSCGGITQTGDSKFCVFRQEAASLELQSQACSDDKDACDAFKWTDPSMATTNASCGTEQPVQTYPTLFELKTNSSLPGDYCNVTEECYDSFLMSTACTASVCIANTTTDSPCFDAKDCPMSHTCNADKVCAALPKNTEACTDEIGCLFNAVCVTLEGKDAGQCVNKYTLANGVNYTLTNEARPTPVTIIASQVCVDGHAFPIDAGKSQCRPADRNFEDGVKGLARPEAGLACVVLSHNNETAASWELEANVTSPDTSMCGFNVDEKAYCAVRFGDEEVLKVMRPVLTQTSSIMCHQLSGNPLEGSYCADLKTFTESKDGFQLFKTQSMLSSAQQSANVINNDRCVAETIMADFWQAQFGSALTQGILGVGASLLAFILL